MEKSGYDVNFVDDLPDYLTCVICRTALRNPVLLVNCGHRICNVCFETMKEHATRKNTKLLCPHDRMDVDINKVVEDKGINRVVLDLKVKCTYYIDGCQWTGELRNLEAHSQRECRFMEQERTHMLLQKLQERLDTCEMNLKESNKEIGSIKDQFHQRGEEITILKERCKDSEERIMLLEKKIEQQGNQSIEKNTASESGVELVVPANKYDVTELTNNQLQFDQLDKEIKLLKQDVAVIKDKHEVESQQMGVMKQLISNKKVVYKWKLEHYTYWQNNNEYVDSPHFYSGVQGHCCKLRLKWFGSEKGCIGMFFQLCYGIYDHEIREAFTLGVHLEITDKNGIKEEATYDPVEIKCRDLKMEAYGPSNFLNMPRLGDFIIDDNLVITCILTPE